jgi:hypothetical protein
MTNNKNKEIDVMTKNNVVKKMIRRVSVAGFAVALVAIVVSATVGVSNDAHAADMRPFKGTASGIFTGPDSGSGTVSSTHIRHGDVVFTGLLLNMTAPTPDGANVCLPVYGGYQKFTASNGDYIEMDYNSGRFCVDPATGAPVYGNFETTITNGSGKFNEAVGSISIEAKAVVIDGQLGWRSWFVGDSWIHY